MSDCANGGRGRWTGVTWNNNPSHYDVNDEKPTVKCPMKFRLLQFEGGEECDKNCAWRVRNIDGSACAISIIAEYAGEKSHVNGYTSENTEPLAVSGRMEGA